MSSSASRARHLPAAPVRLGELDDLSVGDRALDVHDAAAAIDVAALERRPLLRAQPGRGRERRQRPADRRQLGGRPRRCNTLGRLDSFAGSVNLRRLRWRHWGDWQATARGIERGYKLPLRRIPVRSRVSRPRGDCFGDRIYTTLKATSRYGSTLVRFLRAELLGGRCSQA
jgi:hypothetical protein